MSLNSVPASPVPNAVSDDAVTGMDDRAVAAPLATKLLGAWLANRSQTLMPHTLNFRTLAADEVALVVAAMAAAAQCDGATDAVADHRAELALTLVEADAAEIARFHAALAEPQPLAATLAAVRAAGIGAHAYAGALLVCDRASPVAQAFLTDLAARLALPGDLARALESRYRT